MRINWTEESKGLNRAHSSDSLDNGHDDVVCSSSGSSSPTDFTSDDETGDLFLISGLPKNQKQRSRKYAEVNRILYGAMPDEGHSSVRLFSQPRPQLDAPAAIMPAPSRTNNSSLADRQCARLVETRTLMDAVDFVAQNRVLIDNMTRVVTQEAPGYRNTDISQYQIDYSVKESFNPNFWLDREPIVTTADGNCQYHAISLSLTGTEAYTSEVRLATAVAVLDNREWFDAMLKVMDKGNVLDLVHTIARSYSWGDETTLKAIAVAIKRRIFLYTCNTGKEDFETVKSLSKEELLEAFIEKKYRGGTGIHTYADPLVPVAANNYIMLFHKSDHFIAVLPTTQQPTMFEPYNPIVPTLT